MFSSLALVDACPRCSAHGGPASSSDECSLAGAAPRPLIGGPADPGPGSRGSCSAVAREGRVPAPSGANTTTRASPDGPHRVRAADPNATGGHPGAVNSNSRSSRGRAARFNRTAHRSAHHGHRPSSDGCWRRLNGGPARPCIRIGRHARPRTGPRRRRRTASGVERRRKRIRSRAGDVRSRSVRLRRLRAVRTRRRDHRKWAYPNRTYCAHLMVGCGLFSPVLSG